MLLTKRPLSEHETRSIYGLAVESYDAVVSAGLPQKSAAVADRQSALTPQRKFHNSTRLTHCSHLDSWAGILDQDGLSLTLDRNEIASV